MRRLHLWSGAAAMVAIVAFSLVVAACSSDSTGETTGVAGPSGSQSRRVLGRWRSREARIRSSSISRCA